ncbi:restriction endonuclease subunit S [Citrobacter sp. Cf133]|uniref:restriction endonuclease subunit S n=1 Tax=Citrobacter TaxID=544 RepID=UPI0015E53E02|nr:MULTISPECIES: restriction endonuclease subunit S [Citrobacter]MDM3088492.1 restriction endonuclease subunit S [Citrobacter sp. Cf133]MDV1297594.1 restriction endonuclease subunit S [Citrobacter freundii]MEB0339769.1 restriction endonuclease subunit S [Citrobacter freundii]QLN54268.1 restriction endonuclease subunit S [Citrobacter freundii]QLN63956.1 restriction endonuclease subunit S [Citrobacter freundii]
MVPKGWTLLQVSDICKLQNGNSFKPHEWDTQGLPIIRIQNLNGSDNYNYFSGVPQDKWLVEPGQLLFSWAGTKGVSFGPFIWNGPKGVLNQHIYKVFANENVHGHWLYLALLHITQKIEAQAHGFKSTLLHVQKKDIDNQFVLTPPVAEQKKIAQILSTWDNAISVTEKLLTNSQLQKKALMQKLLTGKKRLLDERGVKYGGEWHRAELGAVLDYMQPTPYLVDSTDYNDSYSIPVLTAGKSFILGYTNEEHGIYHAPLPAIIFDDFTTDSKFVDFEFKAKSSAMKILTAKKGVSAKYIFEAMQMLKFKIGGHQRHWISIYSNLVIPIPDAKEQQKIASALSTADAEISTLEKKLACLKEEKKALMQQLLTGKRRVKMDEAVAA